uniref:HAT C-terminal dimerisation domain-containing protein n=1 Tax=Gadus morhua TaxID=8049 RepID=A0A8C5C1H1_GADMO
MLSGAIEEWGLTSKTPAVVTNNAANMVRAVELLQLTHVGCFAHTLNLASQVGLKIPAVSRLLGRVRRIATFFHRSTTATHIFKDKQKMLQLPAHKLTLDVVTRWNSALDMVDRFLEQQPAISATLLSPDVRRNERDLCSLTEEDVTTAEDLVRTLQPLKAATQAISEDKRPTLSIIAPLLALLQDAMTPSEQDSPVVRDLKAAVKSNLRTRYGAQKGMLYGATALDPRFKALPSLTAEEQDEVFSRLQAEAATAAPDAYRAPSVHADGRKTPSKRAEEEITKYRAEPPASLNESPLTWWRSREGELPLVARLAGHYLCVPGTSVASERVFSTAGDIITAKRSCITPEHVNELLFLNKNL